jgi:hypothetical protein
LYGNGDGSSAGDGFLPDGNESAHEEVDEGAGEHENEYDLV